MATPADFHERIAFKFVDGRDGNMTAMEDDEPYPLAPITAARWAG